MSIGRKSWLLLFALFFLFSINIQLAEAGAQKTDKGCNKCEKNKTPPEKKQPQAFQTCEVWQQQGVPDNTCPVDGPTPSPPSTPGTPSPDCHVDNNMQCSKKERKYGRGKADKHNTANNNPNETLAIAIGISLGVLILLCLISYALYNICRRRRETVIVNMTKDI